MGKTALGPAKERAASRGGTAMAGRVSAVKGRERCSGLPSHRHLRPLKAVAGGRDQRGRDFISSAGCGPYSNVRDGAGARVLTPAHEAAGSLPLGGAPAPQAGSFSSALGKVGIEFPFYRNLNGGSEAEVKCPSRLDGECQGQGSIETTHLRRACQSLASPWGGR